MRTHVLTAEECAEYDSLPYLSLLSLKVRYGEETALRIADYCDSAGYTETRHGQPSYPRIGIATILRSMVVPEAAVRRDLDELEKSTQVADDVRRILDGLGVSTAITPPVIIPHTTWTSRIDGVRPPFNIEDMPRAIEPWGANHEPLRRATLAVHPATYAASSTAEVYAMDFPELSPSDGAGAPSTLQDFEMGGRVRVG